MSSECCSNELKFCNVTKSSIKQMLKFLSLKNMSSAQIGQASSFPYQQMAQFWGEDFGCYARGTTFKTQPILGHLKGIKTSSLP